MASTSDYYPIVGIQDGLNPDKHEPLREVHLRMEVDDWFTSDESIHVNQRALFFPAIWRFSQMSPHEKLSWFQIAGIHGMPYVSWDEPKTKPGVENLGYCTHNSILFATWHRPYVLLFEQVIFEFMKEEINWYPEEERLDLEEAARAWRLPYWDWALKKPIDGWVNRWDYNVPLAILNETVEIKQPGSKGLVPFKNALYQFTMPGNITMGHPSLKKGDQDLRISVVPGKGKTYPFDQCQATSRHPEGKGVNRDWILGKQNNQGIVKKMRDYRYKEDGNKKEYERLGNTTASLRGAFYRVLTITKFEDFATERAPGHGAKPATKEFAFDSSENIHDLMHLTCGGDDTEPDSQNMSLKGHMSKVPVAAFDPIFWIHHCNVDRMVAIWQILHDDTWFDGKDPRDEDEGNYYIKPGHPDKPDDPLRPFHKEGGGYWTSSDVREVTALGYTYPGLEKWHYTTKGKYDKQKHLNALCQKLNWAYNSDWSAVQKSRLTADPDGLDGPKLARLSSLGEAPIDMRVDDYVVNVIYEKFELDGHPFIIHIFVGKVPDEVPYKTGHTQVGQVVNFSAQPGSLSDSGAGCGNCRRQQADHVESTGRVALTNALITRWKNKIQHENSDGGPSVLGSMNREDVVPFLKSNLHWRVTSRGMVVDSASLKVSLAVGRAEHYADRTKMSIYHSYKPAYEVTHGRPGGAGPDDYLYPPHREYRSPLAAQ
ncbi:Di-copper centre-containing protein [Daldinia bambusicola]|nr:Di-copper centre-containing protein [Daldinia bambusicola]